jgi:hypothetical protein
MTRTRYQHGRRYRVGHDLGTTLSVGMHKRQAPLRHSNCEVFNVVQQGRMRNKADGVTIIQ